MAKSYNSTKFVRLQLCSAVFTKQSTYVHVLEAADHEVQTFILQFVELIRDEFHLLFVMSRKCVVLFYVFVEFGRGFLQIDHPVTYLLPLTCLLIGTILFAGGHNKIEQFCLLELFFLFLLFCL